MSNEPFAFPPPPPPPPRRAASSTGSDAQINSASRVYMGGGRGGWNGREARGGHLQSADRGRGRGHVNSVRGQGPFQSAHVGGRFHGNSSWNNFPRTQSDFQRGHPQSFPRPSPQVLRPPQKRHHDDAFGTTPMRPQAAPAVPSFNADISSLLSSSSAAPKPDHAEVAVKPKKHNQLGLTPGVNGAESESDDDNEEERLANSASTTSHQFEYRGLTSTLKSASEIAVWIAERRRKYPTQAKADAARKEAEEKRLKWEAEKKARKEATRLRREQEESHRKEKEMRQKLLYARKSAAIADNGQHRTSEKDDTTAKASMKAEKLRRKAVKAQNQLAKAEKALAKAQQLRGSKELKVNENPGTDSRTIDGKNSAISLTADEMLPNTGLGEDAGSTPIASTTTSEREQNKKQSFGISGIASTGSDKQTDGVLPLDQFALSDSSDLSESDTDLDDTSSSGSSDSSESDSDDDLAPEVATSKLQGPMRVSPPKRTTPNVSRAAPVCRALLKTGICRFGLRCRFSHDLPAKDGTQGSRPRRLDAQPRRKGLFEVMVEKEQEFEREQTLRAIIALGQHGMLSEDSSKAL